MLSNQIGSLPVTSERRLYKRATVPEEPPFSFLGDCPGTACDMAEPVAEPSSEESLGTTEPAEADPKSPKQKQPRPRRHRRRCLDSFATYFPRVLRRVHEGLSLSQEAVSVLDSFAKDIFERIADEATCLVRSTKRSTISYGEIQTAVRLLLPGDLGKHAVAEGTKALIRYISRR
uniref:H2B.W histone 4 n=1 Tax=Equus caballus TaxID=9796 RepID=A0A5F5PT92_HORSE